MKKDSRTIFVAIIPLLVIMFATSIVTQAENIPNANPVFAEASVYLSSSMVADFTASARLICPSISVSSCSLQRKVNESWVNAGALIPPVAAHNTSAFGAQKDYSSKCTRGYTYRIYAVFSARGKTVTRYSNEATYR